MLRFPPIAYSDEYWLHDTFSLNCYSTNTERSHGKVFKRHFFDLKKEENEVKKTEMKVTLYFLTIFLLY